MKIFIAFLSGLIFSFGLVLSGMTQPQIVIGFMDPFDWNPTLVFVLFAALVVHGAGYYFLKNKKTPVLDHQWHLPRNNKISVRLVLGSIIFGVGWGLAGYCPGPALASVSSGTASVIGFVLTMIAGMKVARLSLGTKHDA